MPTFVYTAYDRTGKKVRGVIEASSEPQAVVDLSEKGFMVVEIKLASKPSERVGRKRRRIFTLSLNELAIFSRQFSTMISAGIRVRDALEILSDQEVFSSRFRKILKEVIQHIVEGKTLSEALEETGAFEPIFINLTRAGEEGGVLDATMDKVANFYESSKALRDEVKASMRYPMFIMGFAILVIIAVSVYIIPSMVKMLGFQPTGLVSFLLDLNDILTKDWMFVVLGVSIAGVGLMVFSRTVAGRRTKELLSNLIPPLRVLSNQMIMERFSRTLGILVGSGVNLTVALKMAADATTSVRFARRIDEVIKLVKEGLTLRDALAKIKIVPQLVYEMVGTGETTGRLDEVLEKVADFYETQVRLGVKKLVAILEPMMIIFIGGFVAFLAYSLYSAMFQAEAHFGGM